MLEKQKQYQGEKLNFLLVCFAGKPLKSLKSFKEMLHFFVSCFD